MSTPKGVTRIARTLHALEAQGYEAAEFDTLAVMVDQHVGHVKALVREGVALGLLAVVSGGGRGKKSTVALSEAGRAYVVALPAESSAGA